MKRKAKNYNNRMELQQGMSFLSSAFVCNPESKKRCKGCALRMLSEWCKYRVYPKESSKGYHWRLMNEYGAKIKHPICKHPDTALKPVPKITKWTYIQGVEL